MKRYRIVTTLLFLVGLIVMFLLGRSDIPTQETPASDQAIHLGQ